MELRVNNKSDGCGRIAEVCIDDEWHEAMSAKVANNSQSPQDISVMIAESTSVMIKWPGLSSSLFPVIKLSVDMTYHVQHQHYLMDRSMK